jgi:Tfp pilus assembly protein PilX
MRSFFGRSGNERGIILPLTLIILTVLVTLVSAMLALGTTEPQISANLVRGAQALSLAEAGADRAIAYFDQDTNGKACLVAVLNPDYGSAQPPALYNYPGSCATGTTTTTLYSAETLGVGSTGSYTVAYTPTTYATVLISAMGCQGSTTCPAPSYSTTVSCPSGSVCRIVRIVVTRQWSAQYGILANNVTVTGNASVEGNTGAVHGNTSVNLGGSDYILQTATSANTNANCTNCTSAHVGDASDSGGGKPQVPIPTQTAADYIAKADVILGGGTTVPTVTAGKTCSTCKCSWASSAQGIDVISAAATPAKLGEYDLSNGVPDHWILDARSTTCVLYADSTNPATSTMSTKFHGNPHASGGNIFSSWTMGNTTGQWSGGQAVDGAYYAADTITVTGGGSAGTPWNATFIAGGIPNPDAATAGGAGPPIYPNSGVITMSGNPVINAYSNASSTSPWYLNQLAMIAGNIKIVGNSGGTTTPLTGTIFATSTASPPSGFSGNIDFSGNAALTGNIVAAGSASVSGSNPGDGKIVYNVAARSRLITPRLQLVSWHAISTLD